MWDLGKAKRRTKALEAEGSKIKAENLRLTDNCNVLPFG